MTTPPYQERPPRWLADPIHLALLAILLAAFALRIYGFNWDQDQLLHPDEYHVADVTASRVNLPWPPDFDNLLDPRVSTLNPRSDDANGEPRPFAYGAMPLYLTDLVAETLNQLNQIPLTDRLVLGGPADNWHELFQVYKVGRGIGMVLDTLTVLICYFLGRRVAGPVVGLLSAAVYAFTPMAAQLAHFYTTDTWLTFFVALSLLISSHAAESGKRSWFFVAGVTTGLTAATKPTGFTVVAVVAVAVAYFLWRQYRAAVPASRMLTNLIGAVALAGIGFILAFATFEFYAILRPAAYLDDLREQAGIQSGELDVPYTRQYVDTIPVLYQFEQLIRWGMGPAAGIAATLGAIPLVRRVWRHRGATEVILLAWLLIFLVVVAVPESKFLRYLAPMLPALAVTAGLLFATLVRSTARRFSWKLGSAVAVASVAGLVLWSAAAATVYAEENPRIEASRWMYANVPAGSAVSAEVWDRSLPLDLGNGLRAADLQYEWVTFDSYRDRPIYYDLLLLADVLREAPPLQGAAEAFDDGEPGAMEQLILQALPNILALQEPERVILADRLVEAADQMGPTAGELPGRTHEAASVIRQADASAESVAEPWSLFAAAFRNAMDDEAGNALYQQLSQIDYYVIPSNRVTAAVPRLPWRYPVQAEFFSLLQDEQLGFELVAEFANRPHLGPIEFNDDDADEAWINYDHPRVLIYQKTGLIPRAQFDGLLASARLTQTQPTREPGGEPLTLDEPAGDLPVVDDARWSASLTGNSWAALAAWVILLIVLHFAGLPWARIIFGRFADGGWAFARILSLIVGGYLVWLGSSLHLFSFRAIWSALTLLVVFLVGWLAWHRWFGTRQPLLPQESQRRVALIGEAVFWLVFGVFLLFRYLNPDSWHWVWGGEKPMEFAHINATLRTAHFPPYDPWYSDGILNYYYYGLYLVAFLIKLTGIPSEIAFNLAQPTFMAFIGLAGFGIAATLGHDLIRRWSRGPRLAIVSGLLGTLLLVGIGNLTAFFRYFQQPPGGTGDGFLYYTWNATRTIYVESPGDVIHEFPYFSGLYADLHAHVIAFSLTLLVIALTYSLVREPRELAVALSTRGGTAERIRLGSRLLLAAITLGSLFATNAWDVPTYAVLFGAGVLLATRAIRGLVRRLALTAGITALVGVFAYIAMLPFLTSYVALFGSVGLVEDPTPFWEFLSHFGGFIAIVVIGLLVILTMGASRGVAALVRPLPIVIIVAGLLSLATIFDGGTFDIELDERTGDLVVVALVVVIALVLSLAAWAWSSRGGIDSGLVAPLRTVAVAAGLASLVLAATGRPVMALALAVAAAGAIAYFFTSSSPTRFVGLMIAGAAGVIATVEVIFLKDDLASTSAYRMNTIFKFYNQAWVLFALSGAALITWMLVRSHLFDRLVSQPVPVLAGPVPPATRGDASPVLTGIVSAPIAAPAEPTEPGLEPDHETSTPPRLATPSVGWARIGLVVSAIVIVMSLFYPVLATGPRLEQRFSDQLGSDTLNSLDWMDYAAIGSVSDCLSGPYNLTFAEDRAVINWFNEEVAGSPVIAEASIGPYRCNGSRISIATGLPTILGWARHEFQQRYPEGIFAHERAVQQLYNSRSPAEKMRIIREYGVEYIVVGNLERQYQTAPGSYWADPAGIAAFEQMVGSDLEVAFQVGDTVVYHVLDASLPAATLPHGPD